MEKNGKNTHSQHFRSYNYWLVHLLLGGGIYCSFRDWLRVVSMVVATLHLVHENYEPQDAQVAPVKMLNSVLEASEWLNDIETMIAKNHRVWPFLCE